MPVGARASDEYQSGISQAGVVRNRRFAVARYAINIAADLASMGEELRLLLGGSAYV